MDEITVLRKRAEDAKRENQELENQLSQSTDPTFIAFTAALMSLNEARIIFNKAGAELLEKSKES